MGVDLGRGVNASKQGQVGGHPGLIVGLVALWVFGVQLATAEKPFVARELLADGNFIIPQVGIIQSLNISVACAVTIYEAFRQAKVDFVLNAGAVARSNTLDFTGVERAAIQTLADDVVGALIGVGDPARQLPWVHAGVAHE